MSDVTTAQDQAQRSLSVALDLAAAGWALTPVTIRRERKPDGSTHKVVKFHARVTLADGRKVGWRHERAWSSDREQVLAWWTDHPTTSFAIGGAANGTEGVDLDVKPERMTAKGPVAAVDAVAWWRAQDMPVGALVQRTPSGSEHHIWRADLDGRRLPQEAGGTQPGVDPRNAAGLFFAAGAYVWGLDGEPEPGHYEIVGDLRGPAELERTPERVLDLFADAAARARPERLANGEITIHDLAWQREQVVEALDAIRAHDRDQGDYRRKLQAAALMYGRIVEQGMTTVEHATERLLDAHRSVWGAAVWPENRTVIADALRDGPALERWRTPEAGGASSELRAGTGALGSEVASAPAPGASAAPRVPPIAGELRAGTGPTGDEVNEHARTSALAESPTIHVDVTTGAARYAGVDAELSSSAVADIAGHSAVQKFLSTQRDRIVADSVFGDDGPDPIEVEARRIASEVLKRQRLDVVREVVADLARPPAPSIASEVISWRNLAQVEPPSMRVRGLLAAGSVSFLAGRSGSYKSFLGVAIALGVATGTNVAGHSEWSVVGRRRVLYVAAEGPSGVALRAQAYAHRHGLDHLLDGWFDLYPRRVNLTSERALADLRAYCAEHGVGFVVYDTWRKMTPGVEENDATPASEVLSRLDELRDDLDVEALIVDHTGHAGERIRGASSKGDDADCVLLVDMPDRDRRESTQRTLVVDKLKDEPTGRSWPIRLSQVPEVTGFEGAPSAVVEVGEVDRTVVEWGAEDLSEMWLTAEVPADVAEVIAKGGRNGDLSAVCKVMRTYATGASGLSQADVFRQLKAHDSGRRDAEAVRTAVRRGWDVLVKLGRIRPVNPNAATRTGASEWVLKGDEAG